MENKQYEWMNDNLYLCLILATLLQYYSLCYVYNRIFIIGNYYLSCHSFMYTFISLHVKLCALQCPALAPARVRVHNRQSHLNSDLQVKFPLGYSIGVMERLKDTVY